MFHDLIYTSPLYTVDGVGTFRFRCRYPTDDDMLAFSSEFETVLERYAENGTPLASEPQEAKKRAERRRAVAAIYAAHALRVIDDLEMNDKPAPENWREEFSREGRPGFVGSMLRAIGVHLFRGPTESSPESSSVEK